LAAAGHTRFIWCRNGQAQSSTQQYTDMLVFYNWVKQIYGASRGYDPPFLYTRLSIQDPTNSGYACDQARLALGFVPFSLMLTDQAPLLHSIREGYQRDTTTLSSLRSIIKKWAITALNNSSH